MKDTQRYHCTQHRNNTSLVKQDDSQRGFSHQIIMMAKPSKISSAVALSLHINKNYGHQIWIENSLGANLKVIDEIIMAISGGTVKIL